MCDKTPRYPTCSPPHRANTNPFYRSDLRILSQGAEPECDPRSYCEYHPRPQYTLLARLGVPPHAHSPRYSAGTVTHAASGTFAHSFLTCLLHPSCARLTPPPQPRSVFTCSQPDAGPGGRGSRNSYKAAEPLVYLKATPDSDSSVPHPALPAPPAPSALCSGPGREGSRMKGGLTGLLSQSIWGLGRGSHMSPAPLRFDTDLALTIPVRSSWSGNGHNNLHPLRLVTFDLEANDPVPSQSQRNKLGTPSRQQDPSALPFPPPPPSSCFLSTYGCPVLAILW